MQLSQLDLTMIARDSTLVEVRNVSVYEAKAKLSELIKAAQHGEEVTILSRGKPVAKLIPIERKRRGGMGMDEGKPGFWIAEDFDAELPDEFWGFDKGLDE